MTALWFAALLGLGSLAIRPALIESLILANGIERFIPAAAPPLGLVARAIIAGALAIIGGLLGLTLGHAIRAAVTRPRTSSPEPVHQPRRPFSAEDLPGASFDAPFDDPELPDAPPGEEPARAAIEADLERPQPPLGKAARRLLAADLATLTPVELVERLGISMQLQRAAGAEPAHRPMPPAPIARLHPAQPARADNEQVLRSALAALQRLSGAA